jgi:hypothetical protein
MKPALEPLGLGWANFQVLRSIHASLGHDAEVDPKVAADQLSVLKSNSTEGHRSG